MELEKWIKHQLEQGVEVDRLFPCKYNRMNGFGYEITLSRKEETGTQHYKVLLTRKDIKQLTLLICQVSRVNLYSGKYEEAACREIQGKHVTLDPKDPSTYANEVSLFTITGTLTLHSEPS